MAITKPVWTENVVLRSAATIAAAGTETHDLDLDTQGYDVVVIQFDITHSTSGGVTVKLLSSPDSGTTDDTISLPGGFATTGTDEVRSVTIVAHPFIQVSITNDDGSNATGNIAVKYSGRQWDTT